LAKIVAIQRFQLAETGQQEDITRKRIKRQSLWLLPSHSFIEYKFVMWLIVDDTTREPEGQHI
jgi:hypothetical protein